ncbi:MAG: Eco57I restriction-modification methylase domain-containing protein [Bdellovibrionales bacterium]
MGAVLKPLAHIVDVLGNVVGRDQPILRIERALSITSLLGEEVFNDENIAFFDPFCKAGELLLACAIQSCFAKSKKQLLDTDLICEEIYKSNRYFALAPDERHHRLSLRTFLGNTHSHNKEFNHIIKDGHYLSETDGRLDKEKFEKEFTQMIEYIKSNGKKKRIVCAGNPPYQESDGGFGKSAKSIYDYFTEKLIESNDISEFVLVIPARWFGGGKGLDSFREMIRTSGKVKTLRYFKKSNEIFPTVDINGGVCFLHFDKSFNGETAFSDGKYEENLHLTTFDIITDDPRGYSLVQKILEKMGQQVCFDVAWPENHLSWQRIISLEMTLQTRMQKRLCGMFK